MGGSAKTASGGSVAEGSGAGGGSTTIGSTSNSDSSSSSGSISNSSSSGSSPNLCNGFNCDDCGGTCVEAPSSISIDISSLPTCGGSCNTITIGDLSTANGGTVSGSTVTIPVNSSANACPNVSYGATINGSDAAGATGGIEFSLGWDGASCWNLNIFYQGECDDNNDNSVSYDVDYRKDGSGPAGTYCLCVTEDGTEGCSFPQSLSVSGAMMMKSEQTEATQGVLSPGSATQADCGCSRAKREIKK